MNSDPSITFNKQKMFNMYDAASFVPYFGPKNINPYSKNDPKSLFKEKEHYITNPSMLGACIDLFSGTPVQDQTGPEAGTLISRSDLIFIVLNLFFHYRFLLGIPSWD